MRRSDMVKAIASELVISGKPGQMLNFDVAQEYADIALRVAQELGTLPPPSSFNLNVVDNLKGFVAEVSYDYPINQDYSLNFWDKE